MLKLKTAWLKLPPIVRSIVGRTARTFVGVFAASLAASGVGQTVAVNWSIVTKAAVAAYAASFSILLGLIGSQVGDPNTAAFK